MVHETIQSEMMQERRKKIGNKEWRLKRLKDGIIEERKYK